MESSNDRSATSGSINKNINSIALMKKKKVCFNFFQKKRRFSKSKQVPARASQKDQLIGQKSSRFPRKQKGRDVDAIVIDALKLNDFNSQTMLMENYEVTRLNSLHDDIAALHPQEPSSSCQGLSLILALFYDAFLCRHFSMNRSIEGHAQPYDEASSLFLESIDRGEIPSGLEEMVSCTYNQGKILVEIWDYRSTQEKCPRTSKSLPASILSSSDLPRAWRSWLTPTNRMVLEDLQKLDLKLLQKSQHEHSVSELMLVSSPEILMEQKFLEIRHPLNTLCFDPSPKVSEVASILNAALNVKGQNARFLRSEDYFACLGQKASKFESSGPTYEEMLRSSAPVKTPKNAMQTYIGTSSEPILPGQRRSSSGILLSPKEGKHRIVASQLSERAEGFGLDISKAISMDKKMCMKRKRANACVMPKMSTKKTQVVQNHSVQFKPQLDDPIDRQSFLQAAETFHRHIHLSYKLNWEAVIHEAMSTQSISDKTIPGSMNSIAYQIDRLQCPTQIIAASKAREVQKSQNGAEFQLDLNDIFWEPLILPIPTQASYPESNALHTFLSDEILKLEPLEVPEEGVNPLIVGEIPLLEFNDPLMHPISVIDPISSEHPLDLSMAHGLKL